MLWLSLEVIEFLKFLYWQTGKPETLRLTVDLYLFTQRIYITQSVLKVVKLKNLPT